jgi:hypothetical protein
MATGMGGADGWTLWEATVTVLSSGGMVSIIGGLLWFVRRGGKDDEQLTTLRTEFDKHQADDKVLSRLVGDRFDVINNKLTDTATRNDIDRLRSDLTSSIQILTGHVINTFRRGDA